MQVHNLLVAGQGLGQFAGPFVAHALQRQRGGRRRVGLDGGRGDQGGLFRAAIVEGVKAFAHQGLVLGYGRLQVLAHQLRATAAAELAVQAIRGVTSLAGDQGVALLPDRPGFPLRAARNATQNVILPNGRRSPD